MTLFTRYWLKNAQTQNWVWALISAWEKNPTDFVVGQYPTSENALNCDPLKVNSSWKLLFDAWWLCG